MKILVLVNEDFEKMVLGKNTTLAYILAAVGLRHDVLVYKISDKIPGLREKVNVFHLNNSNALRLVEKYKIENRKIVDGLLGYENQGTNSGLREFLVEEFCAEEKISLLQKQILLSEINFVIQRLEPMKSPFPPVGEVSIGDFLSQFKKLFPDNFIFNFPVNSYADKELPLVLAQNYSDLATPTAISFHGDLELPQKLQNIALKYSEIFSAASINSSKQDKIFSYAGQKNMLQQGEGAKQKIVLKPDDSAQALGVFAVEIKNDGLNLAQLKTKTVAELMDMQLYEINLGEDARDANEIIDILCFVQFAKTKQLLDSRIIASIAKTEIADAIHSLYGKKILLQPFLEGVRLGDIRINLAKMSDGNFKVVGAVFRKSLSYVEKNFTTCLTTGASRAQAVADNLSAAEEKNLTQKIQFILQQLNHDEALKAKYREVTELGCDFLIVGNSQDVYWGEANHYCPALIPFSESLEKAKKTNFYNKINGLQVDYDGGLAIISEIINQQLALQNFWNQKPKNI